MSLFTGGGLILNNSLTNIISNNSEEVGNVKVRVNSIPTHQLIKGEADSIQISLKQWQPRPQIRVELLELETDRIGVNLGEIRELKRDNWQNILKKPLNMGWRTIMTEKDINNLIKSPQAQSVITKFSGDSSDFELLDLSVNLQPNNRVGIDTQLKLPTRGEEILNVSLEFNLELIKGHTLKISDIKGTLNDRQLSSKLLQGFVDNINNELSLRNLEKSGITVRLLRLNILEDNVEIAGFVNLQPSIP
ncbi:DUF2993 domain-containing protein [Geminocystis sp. NIES-3709]|uniref:LmeA family phospholipid-binding protein n=1 Tax=Geminocystis sp. NIES-3709 TaxID=1617448 RepID=UPI0005FC68AD|nr:DUF2993 domain-containing protein [Geminocystis sp. NIES-3709]BAQ66694.1 hypothetical protein GM3709_3459 [Geminocystis sp. NIES-3709]